MMGCGHTPFFWIMYIEEKILSALERIHTASRASIQKAGQQHGLSPLQAQIMHYLRGHEDVNTTRLAEQFAVSRPTISDSVAALEKKKLIRKSFRAEDARGYTLALTAKGKVEAATLATYAGPFLESVGNLTDAQKQALMDALLNLLHTMEQQGLISRTHMCLSCRHFGKDVNGSRYYCHLMDVPLGMGDLRVDCSEHAHIAS